LYILQGTTLSALAAVASSEVHKHDITKLWHMKIGHMSERGIQILTKSDRLCGHMVGTANNFAALFTKLVPTLFRLVKCWKLLILPLGGQNPRQKRFGTTMVHLLLLCEDSSQGGDLLECLESVWPPLRRLSTDGYVMYRFRVNPKP